MLDYLFSPQGRTNRTGYFMFFVLWILIVTAYLFGPILIWYLTGINFVLPGGMWALGTLLIAWILSSIAITIRRLHDIDLFGWVIVIMFVLGCCMYGLMIYREFLADLSAIFRVNMTITGLGIFLHCYYVLLMVWPGSAGSNRFG